MRLSTRLGSVAALVTCLTASCTKRSPPPPATVTSAAPARPPGATTPELEELVRLSKSGLSPEAKRAGFAALLEKFPPDHIKEREELFVRAVARGAYDPPEWTTVTANFKGRRAEVRVSVDALTILGVRIDVTADGAQRIADLLGTVLPTPRILQLIWEQATARIEPCTLPADLLMASSARMIEHSACVDQRIAGRKGLVANEGKHWVASTRTAGKEHLAANYGWFIKGRRPIQPIGTRHDTAHTDYSQIMRLVKPELNVDGRELDIRHAARSPELWGLVTDEGPLLVWPTSPPDRAPSASRTPAAAAPPPAAVDPKGLRLTLRPEGMPIGPEQLPPSTTALRRTTLSRRVVAGLRLRPQDVPEAAYVSAGAAACGGRDVFFDLMNDVPVALTELERTKDTLVRALACGKALFPLARAGTKLYEVGYGYHGVPSGFELLSVSNDALRGSRLMVAVNHGYLAAPAPEVPSLLERLASSAPPPPDVAELAALFLERSDADEVTVAKGGGGCGVALDFASPDLSTDETTRERVLDAINDNAVLCGSQTAGSFDEGSLRLIFTAKDETAALAIESALKRRALEIRSEAGVEFPESGARQAFHDALRSTMARAAQAASIDLKGRRLSMTMTLAANAAEKLAMAPLLDARAAKAKLAADIVQRLARGALPSATELEAFAAPAPSPSAVPGK